MEFVEKNLLIIKADNSCCGKSVIPAKLVLDHDRGAGIHCHEAVSPSIIINSCL